MTALAPVDRVLRGFDADKKLHIRQDFFISRISQHWSGGYYGTIARFNSNREPVWFRQIFSPAYPGAYDAQGRECVLSKDGQFLYVVGANLTSGTDNFYKLNAATGETVWSKENTIPWERIVIDHAGDIIIWGFDGGDGYLKKYNAAGTPQWTAPYDHVSAIVVDSNNNIYLTHTEEVGGYNIRKLNSSGVTQAGIVLPTAPFPSAEDIAINKYDDIFVTGTNYEPSAGVYHRLYKYDTTLSALVASAPLDDDSRFSLGKQVVCDSLGNVFASDEYGIVEKFSSNLVSQWANRDAAGTFTKLICDVQNRIHIFDSQNANGYRIRDKDGVEDQDVTLKEWTIEGVTFAREVYLSHYTDQSSHLAYTDMACFMDDTIPEFTLAYTPTSIGQKVWRDRFDALYWEAVTGIFESLVDDNTTFEPGESEFAWEMLSRVPSSMNSDWDTYTALGFAGGIGGAPQFYTVSFFGMIAVGGGPSAYNGEYLMIRGPGLYGFFFGVQHDADTRINFNISEDDGGGAEEKVHFGTEDDATAIFKFQTFTDNQIELSGKNNENTPGSPGSLAHSGFMSIYPGKHPRWDVTTIWAVDDIVAWQGFFYKANNQNSNSEPPSADWTVQ